MGELQEKISALHAQFVKSADLIPLDKWGFDQGAFEVVKTSKNTIVNATLGGKMALSSKQKKQIARGVGAVPRKVSQVCALLSGVSVTPKRGERTVKAPVKEEGPADKPVLDPTIAEILKRKGAKRRASNVPQIVPTKKPVNEENAVTHKIKTKAPMTDQKRQELKQKRKERKQQNRQNKKQNGSENVEPAVVKKAEPVDIKSVDINKPAVSYSKLEFVLKEEKELTKAEKRKKLSGRDYKALQAKVQKRHEYLKKVKASNPEKGNEIESSMKWDTAMNRAEGTKDNPELLARALKNKQKLKTVRKTKWAGRMEKVDEDKRRRQEKRDTNIQKRREVKVNKKLERARKKGRLV